MADNIVKLKAMFLEPVSLRDLALLDMKGSGSRTYYVPGAAMDIHYAAPASDEHQPEPNTHQPRPNTHQLLVRIPESLRQKMASLGRKPRRSVLQPLLQELCQFQALSARELATLLGRRDPKNLVREFLSPMVAEGVLAYTIPEMENHPEQRYTVPVVPAED